MATINKDWFVDRLRTIKLSQRQLAKRMGLDPAAITNMLGGSRRMTMDEAKTIAEILLVPVTEVMRQAGIDVTDDVRKVPIAGYIGPGSAVSLLPSGTHDIIVAPADVPAGSFALQLRVANNPYDGWIVFVSGQQQPAVELLDRYCILAIADGRMLSAMIRRGYKSGLHNLLLLPEGNVLENHQVAWGARVLWILPT